MKYCLFSGERIYDFIVTEYLEILKNKLETSLFAVKLYDLKNNLYAKVYAVETQEYSSHVISGSNYTPRT